MVDVYLNDKYAGSTENAEGFVKEVREKRRQGKISKSLNIAYNKVFDEVYIDTSRGRTRRPLIVAESGKSRLTEDIKNKLINNQIKWDDLIEQGVIEYLDALEEENALVALNVESLTSEHTHLEISPSAILGITTSLVPYSNFGQSSRLNRGSKTQKQSLGLYAANYLQRIDTDVSILQYPQRPIVQTYMHELSNYNKHPSGQNIIIALMSYEGFNMQDSIVLNEGSVQRGLARSIYYRPYTTEELRYSGGLIDEIGIPDKEVKGYKSEKEYRLLEDDGIIFPEAVINPDDVLIGKTSPPRFLGELENFSIVASSRRESSVSAKHGEGGIIDMVLLSENESGNKIIQIRVRDQRIPEVGDKFASRHGQKGVIGMVIPERNMPFSASGIIPDIIFSPHSVPSRMTISHLIEILAGKVGALSARYIDGTIFESESEADLRKELLEMGFDDNGTEIMYNGVTGEEYKVKIFIGNIYYLKLKHMVANKLHARASGRIQLLTRQPIEGRSKGGGLRLGEMEKDCFVAHGAALLLKERFDSDKAVIYVCEECGMLAVHDEYRKKNYCLKCGSNVKITPIEISYAFKLLLDELKSIGIYPKLELKNRY